MITTQHVNDGRVAAPDAGSQAIAQIKRQRDADAALLALLRDELVALDQDPDNATDMHRAISLCEVIEQRILDHRHLDANLTALQVAELAWKESLNA